MLVNPSQGVTNALQRLYKPANTNLTNHIMKNHKEKAGEIVAMMKAELPEATIWLEEHEFRTPLHSLCVENTTASKELLHNLINTIDQKTARLKAVEMYDDGTEVYFTP